MYCIPIIIGDMHYNDLLQAFQQPMCPICYRVMADVDRYLDSLLYEYSNKVPTHEAMRAGRGMCSIHSHQLQHTRKGTALNVAVMFNSALDEVIRVERGEQGSGLSRFVGGMAQELEPRGPCIACERLQGAETAYIEMIAEHIDDATLHDAYHDSGGLCLPHVRIVLRRLKRAQAAVLLDLQRPHWHSLQAELQIYMKKHKVEHRDMVLGEEADSWQRALRYVAGAPEVFGLRRK